MSFFSSPYNLSNLPIIINNTINLSNEVTEEHCKDASKFLTTNLMNRKLIDVINNFEYYKNRQNFYSSQMLEYKDI